VLSSLVTLLSLPLALHYLGPERYGAWATIASTVVFLNLFDFGIAGTLTNHIARSYALRDREYAARYTTNAFALSAAVACTAGAALALAWAHIDWVKLFNVSPRVSRSEVSETAAVAIALVLAGFPASLCSKIFAGHQEVHLGNVVVAAGTLANLAGLLAGIALRVSMPILFVMAAGGTTLCNLAALVGVVAWQKPWLRPRLSLIEWPIARELLSSGSGFFLLQIAGAVVFSSDNVVVSHYLGAARVTPYSVTWRLVGLTAVVQGLVFPALWPAYAEAYAKGDYGWLRVTFRTTMRVTLALNMGFALLLVAAGKPLIHWWAGEPAVPSTALLAAMALWAVISGCMTVESCLLAAVDRTRAQGVLSIIAAALNLALSIALVQRIGSLGVIVGTILSYLIVLVVPQSLIVRDVLKRGSSPSGMQKRQLPIATSLPV
jgi:O-antigen/teichoic acid export membrane protein